MKKWIVNSSMYLLMYIFISQPVLAIQSKPGQNIKRLVISSVQVIGEQNKEPPKLEVYFNSQLSDGSISDFCKSYPNKSKRAEQGTCLCKYSWKDTVGYADSAWFVSHLDYGTLERVDSNVATCIFPRSRLNEISENTRIWISIEPNNPSIESSDQSSDRRSFYVKPYEFVKITLPMTGDFSDGQGNVFSKIFHYQCHKKSDSAHIVDFYIPSYERGMIAISNKDYICPDLFTPGIPTPEEKFEYALSIQPTWIFGIPVETATRLEWSEESPSCGKNSDFFLQRIGYAAFKFNDGTCPEFRDSHGIFRSTFPLKKFLPNDVTKTPIFKIVAGSESVPTIDGYSEDTAFDACVSR